jgi:hypothetical protein
MKTFLPATGGGSSSTGGSPQYNARVVTSSPASRARSRHCGIKSAQASISWKTAASATSRPTAWASNVKSTTTPKLPLHRVLHVHVDQVTGPGPLVADRRGLRRPDHLTGQRVTRAQAGHLVSTEDPAHRPGRHPQLRSEPVLTSPVQRTGGDDLGLHFGAGPGRCPVRARRPVFQPGLPLDVETGDPPVGALAGDAHGLGHVRNRHPQPPDPVHEQATTMERQSSVTVRHEDLRLVKTAISTAPGVFAQIKDQLPTSWPSTPRRPADRRGDRPACLSHFSGQTGQVLGHGGPSAPSPGAVCRSTEAGVKLLATRAAASPSWSFGRWSPTAANHRWWLLADRPLSANSARPAQYNRAHPEARHHEGQHLRATRSLVGRSRHKISAARMPFGPPIESGSERASIATTLVRVASHVRRTFP